MADIQGLRLIAVALATTLLLSACQSEEDRLAEYVSSGNELSAAGDLPRAIIQYRNALRIDPEHVESRAAIGMALMKQGDLHGAQQEFTALSERFPDQLSWRRALGDIALVRADWTALETQAERAAEIAPDEADTTALQLAVAFRRASSERDKPAMDLVAHKARAALAAAPDDEMLLRIVVEHLAGGSDPSQAIPVLDAALARDPHKPELQILRIRLLADAGMLAQAEDRLLTLATLYPQDAQIATILAARYMSKGDVAAAEAVLRGLADGAPASDTTLRITLVRFLQRVHGEDVARAELQRLAEAAGKTPAGALYLAMDRALRFDAGEQDTAVTDLDALTDGIEGTAEGLQIRVLKARFEDRLGNRDRARSEIAAILTQDPGNVSALKLQAEWLIELEQPKPAIVALRTARAQAPRDTDVMNLLAAAHMLDGTPGLALEQLAAATEISGQSARESERYARALVDEGRIRVAQRVLEAAHDKDPRDVPLMAALSGLYVETSDWVAARMMMRRLIALGTPVAMDIATPLQAAIFEGEGQRAAGLEMMDALLAEGDAGYRSAVLVIQSLVRRDHADVARSYLDRALDVDPTAEPLQLLDASLREQEGDLAGAEAILRTFVNAGRSDLTVRRLFFLLKAQDRTAEAEAVLAAGLDAFPASRDLRLIESNRLEASGDVAGAIAVLEALNAEEPGDVVTANNLASLISVSSDDPADLARAARIVADLRADSVPAIADTIGWIAFRRGDTARAIPLLERASRGLPLDLGVQLRLGQAYVAVGRIADARAVLDHVAAADHPLSGDARAYLADLPVTAGQ
ncbi:MAG: tetratricopeptide repeat protein [Jannaschia sp.]